MHDFFIQEALAALLQVIMIDLRLAGDNAIVIGLAAADPPRAQRNKAILVGIVAATASVSSSLASPPSSSRLWASFLLAAFCSFGCAGRYGVNCAYRIATRRMRPTTGP